MTEPLTKYQMLLGIEDYLKGGNAIVFHRNTNKFAAGNNEENQKLFQFESLDELGDNVTHPRFSKEQEPPHTNANALFDFLAEDIKTGGSLSFDDQTGWLRFYCAKQEFEASYGEDLLTVLKTAAKIQIDLEEVLNDSESALLIVELPPQTPEHGLVEIAKKTFDLCTQTDHATGAKGTDQDSALWHPSLDPWKGMSLWSLTEEEIDKIENAAATAQVEWLPMLQTQRKRMLAIRRYAKERLEGREGRSTHYITLTTGAWAEPNHKTRSHFHQPLIFADRLLADGIVDIWKKKAETAGDKGFGTQNDRLEIWEVLPSGHKKRVYEIVGATGR